MNYTWAAVAIFLQYRDPTPLKIITRYIIIIQPNTEKGEGLKGQLEIKVLIEIYKEVYNTVTVCYLKSGDIKVTLKDQQANEQTIRAGDRLREYISIKVL